MRKILLPIIAWLYRITYQRTTLEKVNNKLIRPVPGLIVDGVQYFEFVNLGDMPEMRLIHYNYMREELVMGIDRELQLKLINKILDANQEKDSNRIAALGFMFKDIITNITTVESLYNVASVMYFDDKEDIAQYDLDYANEKINRFKRLQDKSFFFGWLLRESLKNTGKQLPADIQQFLNDNAARLKYWKQILSEPTDSTS